MLGPSELLARRSVSAQLWYATIRTCVMMHVSLSYPAAVCFHEAAAQAFGYTGCVEGDLVVSVKLIVVKDHSIKARANRGTHRRQRVTRHLKSDEVAVAGK